MRPKIISFFLKSVLTCKDLERGLENPSERVKYFLQSEVGAVETPLLQSRDLILR
jgi:hypothetical protein